MLNSDLYCMILPLRLEVKSGFSSATTRMRKQLTGAVSQGSAASRVQQYSRAFLLQKSLWGVATRENHRGRAQGFLVVGAWPWQVKLAGRSRIMGALWADYANPLASASSNGRK
jgi:hypothetical protein